MLLIFRTNDLLRGLDSMLGIKENTTGFVTMAQSCANASYYKEYQLCPSLAAKGLLYLKCSSALEDVTGRHSVHQYQHRDLPPSNTRGITSSFFPLLLSWGIFFTGTKWCGAGNIAANSTDLGTNYQTDVCCRDHDFCTDIMPAGTCKYGICNNSSFTRSKCECDEQFRSCLGNSTETASTFVGLIFFNYVA